MLLTAKYFVFKTYLCDICIPKVERIYSNHINATKSMADRLEVKELDQVVVRFSGDSGDGMQLAGNIFSTSRRR